MTDKDLLLERSLQELETWQTSLSNCADQYQIEHPDIMADLRLARCLQQARLPEREVAGARARVRLTVVTAIEADRAATPSHTGHALARVSASAGASDGETPQRLTVRPRLRVPRAAARVAAALVAAALVLVALLGGLVASSAAASALPGSALYGLKRAEEGLALATAWSDQRRGDVLLTMAGHRLLELRAEARGGDIAEVRSLAAEFDGTMRDLIQLAAAMQTHHEDTHHIAAGLAHTLAAEDQAIHAAQQSGQTIVAQTLAITAQHQQAAIQASNIALPSVSSTQPGTGPSVSGTSTAAGVKPPTAPTPTVSPGVPPTGTIGGSSGGSGGIGGKGGPGGSNGPGGRGHGVRSGYIGAASGGPVTAVTATGASQNDTCYLANWRQPV